MNDGTQELVVECKRQEEACLRTSIAIFEWIRVLRFWRVVFVIAPIILASVAAWQLIAGQAEWKWIAVASALVAGIIPAVYRALDLDVSVSVLAANAHQFQILQDRFRQATALSAPGPFDAFKREFADLMTRMDAVRINSIAPPLHFFKRSQAKINKGYYETRVDQLSSPPQPAAVGPANNLTQITTPKKSPSSA